MLDIARFMQDGVGVKIKDISYEVFSSSAHTNSFVTAKPIKYVCAILWTGSDILGVVLFQPSETKVVIVQGSATNINFVFTGVNSFEYTTGSGYTKTFFVVEA